MIVNCVLGIDSKTLSDLIERYPKGTIWYIDEATDYFASVVCWVWFWHQETMFWRIGIQDQVHELENAAGDSPSSQKHLDEISRQIEEALLLQKSFPKARQIMFIPLWYVSHSSAEFPSSMCFWLGAIFCSYKPFSIQYLTYTKISGNRDAGSDRWYSGCFVYSQSAIPVLSESEISYACAPIFHP